MKNFAIIGAAGYIAPRHMEAITHNGGRIVAACDTSDSVGILDKYGYDIEFSDDSYDFFMGLPGLNVDYLVVCTPNDMHVEHTQCGLEKGAKVICEKPMGLTPEDTYFSFLSQQLTCRRIYNVLQLRYHPTILALKANPPKESVSIQYYTPRGKWYNKSWKGDEGRSGGILMNIGIHLFDMLTWIFGPLEILDLQIQEPNAIGSFRAESGVTILWDLSTEPAMGANRTLLVDGEKFDFSTGFTDLHKEVYRDILAGGGYGIDDARPAIELVNRMRGM